MNLGKKILLVSISFLVGIVATIYLINPFIQKKETASQDQQIETLKEEIKTKESTTQIKEEAKKKQL